MNSVSDALLRLTVAPSSAQKWPYQPCFVQVAGSYAIQMVKTDSIKVMPDSLSPQLVITHTDRVQHHRTFQWYHDYLTCFFPLYIERVYTETYTLVLGEWATVVSAFFGSLSIQLSISSATSIFSATSTSIITLKSSGVMVEYLPFSLYRMCSDFLELLMWV